VFYAEKVSRSLLVDFPCAATSKNIVFAALERQAV